MEADRGSEERLEMKEDIVAGTTESESGSAPHPIWDLVGPRNSTLLASILPVN